MPETKRRPGPVPRLSREAVLDAARGMRTEEITLAALGAKLGVTSPALYRYFRDRNAILEALAAEAREGLVPPSSDLPWDEWLRETARRERAMWRTHPELVNLGNANISKPMASITIQGMRVLTAAGFSAADAFYGVVVLSELAHSLGGVEGQSAEASSLDEQQREELRSLLADHLPMSYDTMFDNVIEMAIAGLRTRLPAAPSTTGRARKR